MNLSPDTKGFKSTIMKGIENYKQKRDRELQL